MDLRQLLHAASPLHDELRLDALQQHSEDVGGAGFPMDPMQVAVVLSEADQLADRVLRVARPHTRELRSGDLERYAEAVLQVRVSRAESHRHAIGLVDLRGSHLRALAPVAVATAAGVVELSATDQHFYFAQALIDTLLLQGRVLDADGLSALASADLG